MFEETGSKKFQYTHSFPKRSNYFVIEKMNRDDTDFRRHKESYWIDMEQSLTPGSLSIDP